MKKGRPYPPAEERFWSSVTLKGYGECWEWRGTKQRYGVFSVNKKKVYAHRFSWELFHKTSIPLGLVVDHMCGNKFCVNPSHLQVVTQKENVRVSTTKTNASKTHCYKGHSLSDAYIRNNHSKRICRICSAENQRKTTSRRKNKGLCSLALIIHFNKPFLSEEMNKFLFSDNEKYCKSCRLFKLKSEFYSTSHGGLFGSCKTCYNIKINERRS